MLHVDVAPDLEQLFAKAARARGLRPEDYAIELIEAAALSDSQTTKLNADEFLSGMTAFATTTPTLSEEAMTRESFYKDQD